LTDLTATTKPSGLPSPATAIIMIVEDDVLVRMMVADELRNTYTVIEAATAHEALTILEGGTSVNLVLTDVKMPGSIDGVTLARTIWSEYPLIKIVIWSGESFVTAAADAVFSKPCNIPALLIKIEKLLRPRLP
jgi:two-component system, response regulator PdtaR